MTGRAEALALASPAGDGVTAAERGAMAIERLLTQVPDAVPVDDVEAWRGLWRARAGRWSTPFETAVDGGADADRLGWAFAAGYQAALQALLGETVRSAELRSFCLTEPAGNRPRDIATTATALAAPADGSGPSPGWRIDGRKQWITLGGACDTCLVLAVAEPARAAPESAASAAPAPLQRDLRLFRVPAAAPGMCFEPMPPTRFTPEVPHARLELQGVCIGAGALLPGDGWSHYGKAFRTCEDTLVTAAALAHAVREARRLQWPHALAERLLALLQALTALADQPTRRASGHVALAGVLALAQTLWAEVAGQAAASAAAGDAAAARWARDLPLLQVAGAARAARTARAWERLQQPG